MKTFVVLSMALWAYSLGGVPAGGQDQIGSKLTAKQRRESTDRSFFLNQVFQSVLSGNKIAGEIELMDYQREELLTLRIEYRAALESVFRELSEIRKDLGLDDREGKSKAEIQRAHQKYLKWLYTQTKPIHDSFLPRTEAVLVESQVVRLRQLAVQFRHAVDGVQGFEMLPALRDELELSAEDRQKLIEAVEQAKQQYEVERKKIRRRFERRIYDVLPEKAQELLQKMVGDFYYFD